jgi:hypothetical protein
MRVRASVAATLASAADVRTHILVDHINIQPFSIKIKKESDDG